MGTCKQCGGNPTRYGLAPHTHNMQNTGSLIGSTELLPKEKWPHEFTPDPETGGRQGVWTCSHCNGTGCEPLESYADGECQHRRRFDLHGVLTCMDCAAQYDEKILEWKPGANKDLE